MTRKQKKTSKRALALSLARRKPIAGSMGTTAQRDLPDEVIEACARSLGIKIDKAWIPAIRANLQVTLRHGVLVTDFALDDEAEPAPVFAP